MKLSRKILFATLLASAFPVPVLGSGGPPPQPDYITSYALNPIDRAPFAQGKLGILKGNAPPAVLYLGWRVIHGLDTGTSVADGLATPCCDQPYGISSEWLEARKLVKGPITEINYISTERVGPDYTTIPTCFADAFTTATVTLKDRIGRFGADSNDVRSWLQTQDAVFTACSKEGVTLPSLSATAPDWLKADYAYQQAALALYDKRLDDAGQAFAAIGKDRHSPWQSMANYLGARVAVRMAMADRNKAAFAKAQSAITRLKKAPEGTYGQDQAERLQLMLDFRSIPDTLIQRLDTELNRPAPVQDIRVKFRDYWSLSTRATQKPEMADWIATLRATDRSGALSHATDQWQKSGRKAWLIAALSLAVPNDAKTPGLVEDAGRVPSGDPLWLTAQYHKTRLMIGKEPAAASLQRVESILARSDLTPSDRNIFRAIRAQLASNLTEFAQYMLRSPYCTSTADECIEYDWPYGDGLLAKQGDSYLGIGGDARAVIDRLPLPQRLALGRDQSIPRALRLDITLTNYTRAVLIKDDAALNETATALADLLPQVRKDWQNLAALPSGEAKRFASILVMAKIPSLRPDLADYSRPEGTEPQFTGTWASWLSVPAGKATPTPAFPPLDAYAAGDYWMVDLGDSATNGSNVDLTCAGKCGAGAFPLHIPPFARPLAADALKERVHFFTPDAFDNQIPAGAVSLWDEMLTYVSKNPKDPRAGEALYRLIRVARWGGSTNHLGKRAFALLHSRYPKSSWAKQSPYYYD